MIVVTGAAGFIGANLAKKLNRLGYLDLVLIDDFSRADKAANHTAIRATARIERSVFISWLAQNQRSVQYVFHLGARTDTTESDLDVLNHLNLDFSKQVFNSCLQFGLPLLYASSAATYGDGMMGFDDTDDQQIFNLKPLNPYGISKNEFDKWTLIQPKKPFQCVGLKFFNVYGSNESHKRRMASVVYHAYNQIKTTKKMQLFKSYNPKFEDGQQRRDFIYVEDLVDVLLFFMENRHLSGIFNLGTGQAQSFLELAESIFETMKLPKKIEFIDLPHELKDKYQYFTQANMNKLRQAGYNKPFATLQQGIKDYIDNYLNL